MTQPTAADLTSRYRWPLLIVFLALLLGSGALIGQWARPDQWYADLVKPSFNPPNTVFAPVWTLLYLAIAVVGWRTTLASGQRRRQVAWWAQMLLNWLWTPVFFVAHAPAVALVVIAALLATIIAFIVASWRVDRLSAWLFVPYAAWVGFASLLNAAIVVLN